MANRYRIRKDLAEDRLEIEKKLLNLQPKGNRKLDIKLGQVDRKVDRKGNRNADKLTENKNSILSLIASNPYISQLKLTESIGDRVTANIIKYRHEAYKSSSSNYLQGR